MIDPSLKKQADNAVTSIRVIRYAGESLVIMGPQRLQGSGRHTHAAPLLDRRQGQQRSAIAVRGTNAGKKRGFGEMSLEDPEPDSTHRLANYLRKRVANGQRHQKEEKVVHYIGAAAYCANYQAGSNHVVYHYDDGLYGHFSGTLSKLHQR